MSIEELSGEERSRYARHLMLPEVGQAGQERLKAAQIRLAEAATPEARQSAQSEVAAAQKAGQNAGRKYHRGMGLLKRVRDKLGRPQP